MTFHFCYIAYFDFDRYAHDCRLALLCCLVCFLWIPMPLCFCSCILHFYYLLYTRPSCWNFTGSHCPFLLFTPTLFTALSSWELECPFHFLVEGAFFFLLFKLFPRNNVHYFSTSICPYSLYSIPLSFFQIKTQSVSLVNVLDIHPQVAESGQDFCNFLYKQHLSPYTLQTYCNSSAKYKINSWHSSKIN